MQPFELEYCELVHKVLRTGELRQTRNAETFSIFGTSLTADLRDGFPILQGRTLYPDGVFGELAAMLRSPKNVADFERWGCNYWKLWADKDTGDLNVDYGNQWFNFNGVDQIAELKRMLEKDPANRRMIISSWRPDRLGELSLPCCHYSYQFHVSDNGVLSMVWTQRSVDVMIGLPSDMIFAATWLIAIANEFDFTPGTIKMDFGDTHIYASHEERAHDYLQQAYAMDDAPVLWLYNIARLNFCNFVPEDIKLVNYNPQKPVRFKLHG
jgi:thymidylate synthase